MATKLPTRPMQGPMRGLPRTGGSLSVLTLASLARLFGDNARLLTPGRSITHKLHRISSLDQCGTIWGRSQPSCVGRSEKTSRICYEITTGSKNIDPFVGEVAFFHERPLRSRPVLPPIVERMSANRDGRRRAIAQDATPGEGEHGGEHRQVRLGCVGGKRGCSHSNGDDRGERWRVWLARAEHGRPG